MIHMKWLSLIVLTFNYVTCFLHGKGCYLKGSINIASSKIVPSCAHMQALYSTPYQEIDNRSESENYQISIFKTTYDLISTRVPRSALIFGGVTAGIMVGAVALVELVKVACMVVLPVYFLFGKKYAVHRILR